MRDAAIIALLRATGIRRNELAQLDRHHYDRLTGRLQILGARGSEREGFIGGAAKRAVNAWLQIRGDRTGPLFYPVFNDGAIRYRRMGHYTIHKMLATRAARLDIPRLSPHDFRRTFISGLLDSGVDLLLTQKLAGHALPTSTALYDFRGGESLKQAAATIRVPYVAPRAKLADLKARSRKFARTGKGRTPR